MNIQLLQSTIKRRLLITEFALFNDTINRLFNTTEYKDMIKLICDKEILKQFKSILYRIYRCNPSDTNICPKINEKILLSAFLFLKFPDDSLSDYDNNDLQKTLHTLSKHLVNNILCISNKVHLTSETVRYLFINLNMYSNCFYQYINNDKMELLDQLTNVWCSYEHAKDNTNKKDNNINGFILEKQKSIKRNIIDITKKEEKDVNIVLKKYYDLFRLVDKNQKKAFFDKLMNELIKDEYGTMIEILKELKKTIKIFINYEEQRLLNEYFDVDLYENMIMNKAFGMEEFQSLSNHVFNTLSKLISKSRDEEYKKTWEDINNDNQGNFIELIITTLEFFFHVLDDLKLDIFKLKFAINHNVSII